MIRAVGTDVAFGTNCRARTPHSAPLPYEVTRAFLAVVRRAHPHVPQPVVSPGVRPAEATPNRLGATLADLREAVERAARVVPLVPGGQLPDAAHLVAGVHPGDGGTRDRRRRWWRRYGRGSDVHDGGRPRAPASALVRAP